MCCVACMTGKKFYSGGKTLLNISDHFSSWPYRNDKKLRMKFCHNFLHTISQLLFAECHNAKFFQRIFLRDGEKEVGWRRWKRWWRFNGSWETKFKLNSMISKKLKLSNGTTLFLRFLTKSFPFWFIRFFCLSHITNCIIADLTSIETFSLLLPFTFLFTLSWKEEKIFSFSDVLADAEVRKWDERKRWGVRGWRARMKEFLYSSEC